MRRTLTATAGLLLALGAPALHAQSVCDMKMMTPKVGSWAKYQLVSGGDTTGTMRLALVGAEKRNGTDMVWVENSMQSDRGPMIMEMLVPGFPYDGSGVQEMIMKFGDRPAMKASPQMMGMMQRRAGSNPALSFKANCEHMKLVGSETVTTPAGTFSTQHFKNDLNQSDAWISSKVPFGMVKVVAPSRNREGNETTTTMTLLDSGSGATKSITETPQEMPGMGGMPMGGGPGH
jgi:hypothetical protein